MKKEDDILSETNQQQVLDVMQQSLLDIKQNALRNKMEEDFLTRVFKTSSSKT